jgi:hypothetical protein
MSDDLKELLFKSRLAEADVAIPGVGTVRVRALSRAEVLMVRKATDLAGDVDGPRALVLERKMVATAMVDPVLSESEVARWQRASAAGELEPVTDAIQRLSGMLPTAAKEAYRELEADPEAEFRDEVGQGSGDDGRSSQG